MCVRRDPTKLVRHTGPNDNQDEPQDYKWLRRAKGGAWPGAREGGMWARPGTARGRPRKGSTRLPVTETDTEESVWALRRSRRTQDCSGARARGPDTDPHPPSREHRATHKNHRVSLTVADATERQEIGLAVRVQGLIPLATSSHSYLIVEISSVSLSFSPSSFPCLGAFCLATAY